MGLRPRRGDRKSLTCAKRAMRASEVNPRERLVEVEAVGATPEDLSSSAVELKSSSPTVSAKRSSSSTFAFFFCTGEG